MRHQVALLLARAGHSVYFIQKPRCLFPPTFSSRSCDFDADCISFGSSIELLHHQLRIFPCLHRLNASLASCDLRKTVNSLDGTSPQVIINFNYDAFWLRAVFPDLPILTIINDDFEALGRLGFRRHLTWALRRTCVMSTRVFTVSNPLKQRLSKWCEPELFLPWADKPYQPPSLSSRRNVLLYWGYINNRLDIATLQGCASELSRVGLRLRFVGPMDSRGAKLKRLLSNDSNVEWLPATPFDQLITTDCFAALLPYRLDYSPNLVAQLPNKALQLLSLGLPLISTDLPHIQRAQFLITYQSGSPSSLIIACKSALDQFLSLQATIADFVGVNNPKARLTQLLAGID